MAKLDYMNDYIVPIGVGAIELGLKKWDESRLATNPAAMAYEPLAPYAIAGLGTVARLTNMLSKHDESIKMAVAASLPRVVTGIYEYVTKPVGAASRLAISPVRRGSGVPVSRIRTVVPDSENVRIV